MFTPQENSHLEFIQKVISRLNGNSFATKTWSVSLVSALFLLLAQGSNTRYCIVTLLPAIVFWMMDGYYLYCERLLRRLYDSVRLGEQRSPEKIYSMDIAPFKKCPCEYIQTCFSFAVLMVHLPIVAGIVGIYYILSR